MADQPLEEKVQGTLTQEDNRLGRNYLLNYEPDKRFSTIGIRLIKVPEGYKTVWFKWGKHKGKATGPGIKAIVGIGHLYHDVAVVDIRLRSTIIETENATTRDLVDLPKVISLLNYQVTSPEKAITKVEDFKKTLFEIAEARVRGIVGGKTLVDLISIGSPTGTDMAVNIKKRNLAYDDNGERYKFEELKKMGIKMIGLYMQRTDLPKELEVSLAKGAIAKSDAVGIKEIADAQRYAASQQIEAAKALSEIPEGMQNKTLDTLREVAKEQGNNFIVLGVQGLISDTISKIAQSKIPPKESSE